MENRLGHYGEYGTREEVMSADKYIILSWLGRVRDKGLPLEKDVFFCRAHGQDSAPRLYAPSKSSLNVPR